MQSENNSEKIALGNSTQPGENVGARKVRVIKFESVEGMAAWLDSLESYIRDVPDVITDLKVYWTSKTVTFFEDESKKVWGYVHPSYFRGKV